MQKLGKLFITLLLICVPLQIGAEEVEESIETMNLPNLLEKMGIQIKDPNYLESQDMANIYLFYGSTCPHCHDFLNFLNNSLEEYGKYFRLRAYEVWDNKINEKIMNAAAEELNTTIEGVPFIVIGNQYFTGYSESMNEDILNAIMTEYKAEEKFNVVEQFDEAKYLLPETDYGVVFGFIAILVIILGAALWAKRKNQEV